MQLYRHGIIVIAKQQYQYQQHNFPSSRVHYQQDFYNKKMSIYSGFATRHQQQTYDQCIDALLHVMQKRILRFYNQQDTDQEKFVTIVNKIYTQMRNMESHKYLQPKSSRTIQELLVYLKNKQADQNIDKGNHIMDVKFAQTEQNSALKIDSNQAISEHPKSSTNINHMLKQQQQLHKQQQSQNLRIEKINNISQKQQQYQIRPNTTNTTTNRIRKRISSRNNSNNNNSHNIRIQSSNHTHSFGKLTENQSQPQAKINANTNVNVNANVKEVKPQHQNVLNQSASKLIRISRNQPRAYFDIPHAMQQQASTGRKSVPGTKSKSKRKEEVQNIQQQYRKQVLSSDKAKLNSNQASAEVHELIKGYINKTKKNYIRGYNRRKEQIDDMLRFL